MVVWNTKRATGGRAVKPTMDLVRVFSGPGSPELYAMTDEEHEVCGFIMTRAILRLAERKVEWATEVLAWNGSDPETKPAECDAEKIIGECLGLEIFSEQEMTEWLEEVSKDPDIVQ